MSLKSKIDRIFKEAADGYGFEVVRQTGDGIFCNGCMVVHKRPTKMYTNGREFLCKYKVAYLYNPDPDDDLFENA